MRHPDQDITIGYLGCAGRSTGRRVGRGRYIIGAGLLATLCACASGQPAESRLVTSILSPPTGPATGNDPLDSGRALSRRPTLDVPLQRTHTALASTSLVELSGLSASRAEPGVFWAINDGGNRAALHALAADGSNLGQWPIQARNRDWEALAWMPGGDGRDGPVRDSLLIGDLGDNRQVRSEYRILRITEPDLERRPPSTLPPTGTLHFRYPDGAHDAEAMVVHGRHLLIFTKEKPQGGRPRPSQVYALALDWEAAPAMLEARRLGTLPERAPTLETRLAARLAGLDLLQPTAADIDPDTHTLYLLSYRDVSQLTLPPPGPTPARDARRIAQAHTQTHTPVSTSVSTSVSAPDDWPLWPSNPTLHVLDTHALAQAEALALSPGGWLLIGSEGRGGPLVRWPLIAPDT